MDDRFELDHHDAAVVLGSGWQAAADELTAAGELTAEWALADLPGVPQPTAPGHAGLVRSVRVGGREVLVFVGRLHSYEGHDAATVALPVRTAIAAGCRTIVLTNAAGGLRPGLVPGQAVLIADHLNLTGASPLSGPQFLDLSECWSPRLRALARESSPNLAEGVYAALPGPQYETPAEVRMLRTLGADLVGMSTVLEAIAARAHGAELLGLSIVTNVAASLGEHQVDHADVLEIAAKSAVEHVPTLLTVLTQA